MTFEDELRATMQAHDHEAPHVDELPDRPWNRRRTWLPIAAAAAAVVVIAGGAFAIARAGTHHHHHGAAALGGCPATYHGSLHGTWVPSAPQGVDGRSRLVPNETPADVVVCAYLHADKGALTGSQPVTGNLGAVVETLSWAAPRNSGSDRAICRLVLLPTDRDDYLIRLAYPGGGLWVSAPGDHCDGATNGEFATFENLRAFASAAYRTGAWDPTQKPDADMTQPGACVPSSLGRLGQEQHLVPAGATQVTACARTGSSTTSRTSSDPAPLAAALNRLPTRPYGYTCQGDASGTNYLLRFRYPVGPDVVVEVSPGCRPDIENGSLQSDDASTIVPLIEQLLAQPK